MPRTTSQANVDQLVVRARTDGRALGELYEMYYGRILRFCVWRVFSKEAAEDVTSEVFLGVARSIGSFDGQTEERFRNWLYSIAAKLANAHLRKTIRRDELLVAAVGRKTLGQADCEQGNPGIDWSVLYGAIRRLKLRQQEVITLRFFEQMTHNQIAETLDMKIVTVRVTLSRALARLRKVMRIAPGGGN